MEHKCYGPYEKYVKRPLDCFLAAVTLIALSPVTGITALIEKSQIGSPVFFSQECSGLIDPKTGKERIFRLYKFRSMTNEKDTEGNLLPDGKRLTKVRKVIRAVSIDGCIIIGENTGILENKGFCEASPILSQTIC